MLDKNEIELFRDNVKKFLENEVAPHYNQWEKAEIFPRELWNKMGENGLLCVDVPEEYGGFGANFRLSAVIVEEASRAGFSSLASNISVHSDIVAPYILHLGNEEQKKTWLPKMVTGEAVGAIGMTEPGAGSDLQGLKARADKDGDGYSINGQKNLYHQWSALRRDRAGHQDRPQRWLQRHDVVHRGLHAGRLCPWP
jgi:alkylation response protein AidB-like acyl-CoA dehydrogenase